MYNKELDDYAKAAMIFKPVSGAMASRFTSAAVVEHSPKVFEGLHTPSVDDYMAKEEQEQQVEKKVEESPKVHAARMGMYGPMTREVTVWIPNKLLCKRFGVKDPNPDVAADVPPPAGSVPGWQAGTSASAPEEDVTTESTSYSAQGTHPRKSRRRDLANVGLGDDDDQGRDILTYQRPTMDIFKAIFASDDEDSDDEEQKKDDEDNDTPPAATTAPPISTTVSSTPVVDSSQMSYEPSMGRPAAASPEKIDMGIFRPTFIPRDGKSKKGKDKEQNKQNKEKKKKANKVLVSFELDEDGNESTPKAKAKDKDKQRPKKKRRDRREGGGDDDDDSMWVEKPPPDVMKNIAAERPPELGSESGMESSSNKGRKRAIDFM
jgi:G patch domain-containing protein 1